MMGAVAVTGPPPRLSAGCPARVLITESKKLLPIRRGTRPGAVPAAYQDFLLRMRTLGWERKADP
jgi:hypothetical protein